MVLPSFLCSLLWVFGSIVHAQSQILQLTTTEEDLSSVNNPFASIQPSSNLEWNPCYKNTPAGELGSVSCARLLAPIDYRNASLGKVQLAIIKLSASDPGQAQGAVFFNPGGPGEDPVEEILTNAALLRAQVGNGSDIIAVVPRGVGSTFPPITCDVTDLAYIRGLWDFRNTLPGYTRVGVAESYAIGRQLGLDCDLITPDLIPYIGTVFIARDMEFVRQALGQQKLSYLGYSYGTVLGGTYAALFPDKVGRMVLDAVLDFNDYYSPNKDPSLDIGDADLALENFFQACHDAGPDACALWSATTKEIREQFIEADQRLLNEPLPVPGYGLLRWPLWRSGIYNALYRPAQGFPLVAGVTLEILNGAAGPFIQSYIELLQSNTSTDTYLIDPETGLKNSPDPGSLISCSDEGSDFKDLGTQELNAVFAEYERVSNFFAGVASQFSLVCLGAKLSAETRYTDPFRNITTANPILFVGNTADPTTPIRNAYRMSEAFPGSRVLTINGTGHISYNAVQDTSCATEWIAPYFREGMLPPKETVCNGKQLPFSASDS